MLDPEEISQIIEEGKGRGATGLFLISREIAKKTIDLALSEISQNARKVIFETEKRLRTENAELYRMLMTIMGVFHDMNKKDFIEGFVYTYRILQEQAQMSGQQMPKVSKELAYSYLISQQEALNSDEDKAPQGSFEESLKEQLRTIYSQDREFERGIYLITKYRSNRKDFYHGVVSIYKPIKSVIDTENLRLKLNNPDFK
ncbi:MAG: hypothetical protein Q7R97_02235 [Candidatus Daviesbacteria bacterium]|nr:hypothetical protein [Candidatus Daviesbacteria bacterium]